MMIGLIMTAAGMFTKRIITKLSDDIILYQKTNYPEQKDTDISTIPQNKGSDIAREIAVSQGNDDSLLFTNGSILFKITDSCSASKSKDTKRI
jgi:hypothetical protein